MDIRVHRRAAVGKRKPVAIVIKFILIIVHDTVNLKIVRALNETSLYPNELTIEIDLGVLRSFFFTKATRTASNYRIYTKLSRRRRRRRRRIESVKKYSAAIIKEDRDL